MVPVVSCAFGGNVNERAAFLSVLAVVGIGALFFRGTANAAVLWDNAYGSLPQLDPAPVQDQTVIYDEWGNGTVIDVSPLDFVDLADKSAAPLNLGMDFAAMTPTPNAWKVREYPKYASVIQAAEITHGIPQDLLARLLYQESHYRADIIDGSTKSPVGAAGIAQFMPATAQEMGIDPLVPGQAIDAAGRYLKKLYAIFNNWDYAIAAYNWGPGNMRKFLAGTGRTMPTETKNYVAQITADVPVA